MLYRGTTPYHSFTLPLPMEDVVEVYITYWQNGEVVLEKDINDVELTPIEQDNNSFITDTNIGDDIGGNNQFYEEEEEIKICQATVHLTQEDTLKFKFYPAAEKNIAAIQIRVLDGEDEAYASKVINERIYGVLKDGVI